MKRIRKGIVFSTLTIGLVAVSLMAIAQDRGGPPRFDPEQMQARMMERMQEVMGSSDDEWQVLSPMVSDVMEKQRDANIGGGPGMMFMMMRPGGDEDRGGRGGRGRGPGRGFGPEPSAEVQALQELLEDEDASANDIQSKLAAVRKERKDKQEALEEAQDKLRKVLTVRQEALLVMMGMLE